MIIKIDQSANYFPKKRFNNSIKFIIIHYTGMQSEIESIKRLKSVKSKVSCHYLINRKGLVRQMVDDNKVAWHAGKSKWKTFRNLNEFSIGIELVNRGHEFGYQNFSSSQIATLIKLCNKLKKKYKVKKENFLGHSDIAPLRKLDPGEKFPWRRLGKLNIGTWYKKRNIKKKTKSISQKKIEQLFFTNIHKIGYRYFKINRRNKKKDKLIIRSFQQHYLPEKVTGKIDKKTLQISHFLAN